MIYMNYDRVQGYGQDSYELWQTKDTDMSYMNYDRVKGYGQDSCGL